MTKKQKKKMQMKKVEAERDYMQDWKERGRLKPFTEEGVKMLSMLLST